MTLIEFITVRQAWCLVGGPSYKTNLVKDSEKGMPEI